ncbi:hypothetical protein H9P43_005319 [Blastocladiella emersonii ATCC 22665]|nr:hypothetical protein H9P43_005319 [Blastocladiella emersonii ATCC 22665]
MNERPTSAIPPVPAASGSPATAAAAGHYSEVPAGAHPLAAAASPTPSHSRSSSTAASPPLPPSKPALLASEDKWIDCFIRSETSLDEYTFVKTLGQGTFGKVKLAKHVPSVQHVAIKIIDKATIKTDKQKLSVRREVRLLFLLRHPHVVRVLDVIETADQIYIVMENLPRGELFDHIVKNHHLSEPEARHFMRQIVSALEYCHSHSVIHRDLKPENLLLDSDNNVKLIDFGFVNTFDGASLLDTFCGSPFYASPQMIRGIKYSDPSSDIWSLGVILFAMLSGRLPFDAEDMRKLYDRIASGVFRCPSHFSIDAVDLIRKMLVVDPKKRYTIDQVKAHPWLDWDSASPSLTRGEHYDSLRQPLVPVRPELVEVIQSFGFDADVIHDALLDASGDDGDRATEPKDQQQQQSHPVVGYYRLLSMRSHPPLSASSSKRSDSQYASSGTLLMDPSPPSPSAAAAPAGSSSAVVAPASSSTSSVGSAWASPSHAHGHASASGCSVPVAVQHHRVRSSDDAYFIAAYQQQQEDCHGQQQPHHYYNNSSSGGGVSFPASGSGPSYGGGQQYHQRGHSVDPGHLQLDSRPRPSSPSSALAAAQLPLASSSSPASPYHQHQHHQHQHAPSSSPCSTRPSRASLVSLKTWSVATQHHLVDLMQAVERTLAAHGVQRVKRSEYVYACVRNPDMAWEVHLHVIAADGSLCAQFKKMRGSGCQTVVSFLLAEMKAYLDSLDRPLGGYGEGHGHRY